MRTLRLNSEYIIEVPLIEVINMLRLTLTNGKLKEVKPWHESDSNIVVTCPHHKGGLEKEAACNIYVGDKTNVEYGYFRCWVCDEQGSFVKFVAECFDRSEEFALNWLIKNFGVYSRLGIKLGPRIQLTNLNTKKASNKFLDKSILNKYQSWHPYLAKRKLSRRTCELFNVKYDPSTNSIVFPCFDAKDNLIMLPRRAIETKIFYLDSGREKPVYCLDYIIKNKIKTAIITEGPFDCLTAYEYGVPAIATLGRLSDYQIEQINRSGITTLYLMFDNDAAGREFTNLLKKQISKRIITKLVKIPNGKKDINDLTKSEFTECLKSAEISNRLIV